MTRPLAMGFGPCGARLGVPPFQKWMEQCVGMKYYPR
jgi:hypothetical protein